MPVSIPFLHASVQQCCTLLRFRVSFGNSNKPDKLLTTCRLSCGGWIMSQAGASLANCVGAGEV